MSSPYDRLVDLDHSAIADTHLWEKRAKRSIGISTLLTVAVGGLLVVYLVGDFPWYLTLVVIVAEFINLLTLRSAIEHLRWIRSTRVRWEDDLERHLFDRTAFEEFLR
jgi:hypothetical protein